MSALMTIIIQAQDKASEVAKKVGSTFQGQSDRIAAGMDKVRNASNGFTVSLQKAGQIGQSVYNQLSLKQQQYLQGLSQSQGLLDRMGIAGTRMGNLVQAGYNKVKGAIDTVKSSVDSLKQKIENTTVGNKLITGFNTVKNKVTEVVTVIRAGLGNALDSAKRKVESLQNSLGEVGMAFSSVFGALGLGSIQQATIGLAMTREQMTALMTATMGSKDAAVDFIGSLDRMTNSSLVSLNDLGSALSKIRMSTGMTNEQLKLIAPTVNDIGQRAILMGHDATYAQELMVASFRGLNGEFEMLKTNFGITRQNLIDAGWSGAAEDVEGYNAALQKCLENGGSMDEMLKTTPGQVALIKKAFSTAGREIGEAFMPVIKAGLEFGLWLKETNPWVFKLAIVFGALTSAFAMALPVLGSLIGSFKSLLIFLGILENTNNATTLSTIRQTVAEKARAVAQRASAAVGWIAAAAQNAYTFATSGNVIATVRATAVMIAHRAATLASAVASKAAAGAQALLNAIMSANPIMLVVIAIVALIGILWHLYNTNETVRNAINYLFDGLKQLGAWIWGGLIAAWNALTSALAPVGAALEKLGGAILGRLIEAWNGLMSILAPLGDAFGQLGAAISGAGIEGANNIFSQLWNILQQIWNVLVQVGTVLWEVFGPALTFAGEIISGFFGAALQTVWGILSAIIEYIATLITILADLIAGNITVGEALNLVWNAVGTLFTKVFLSISQGIAKFALDLVSKGVNAAKNFLNGIITWITQLPGKMWTHLLSTINKTILWKNQMVAKAKEAGQNVLRNVVTFISQLPGRVWSWLLSTIGKLASFVSQAGSKARQAGSTIISNIASYLTTLPGKMWDWGTRAIQSFIDSIINAIPGLRSALDMVASLFPRSPPKEGPLATVTTANMEAYGESLGEAFATGINNTTGDIFSNLTPPSPIDIPAPVTSLVAGAVTPTTPNMTMSMGMDTTTFAEGNQEAQNIITGTVTFAGEQYGLMQQNIDNTWNNMTTTTRSGFNTIKNSMQTTLNQIVANNQAGYQKIQSNTASTMTALVTDNRTKYNTIQRNMSTTLTNIANDNKSKYANILNTTKETLTNLQTKTNQSMTSVKQSWNGMRNSLISAASQIRSQTTSEINRLTGNMRIFYRKIQNPALLLAGPMPYRYRNRPVSSLMGKGNAGPRGGRFAGAGPPRSTHENIKKLETSPEIPCSKPDDCFYAGWDYTDPWVRQIMRLVYNYRPYFPDYGNMGLRVGDFRNSTWPVSNNLQLFEALARKIVSGSRYSFYYNSNGRSPYQNAIGKSYNCWDGASIMIALANALGLPAYRASGHWGNIGHVWAVVAGKTFDTTAFQGGYGWSSPKVHAGPAPSGFSPDFTTNNEPVVIDEHYTFDWNIRFPDGLPEYIDEATLTEMLLDQINDSQVVRRLVKNRDFIDYLKTEQMKQELRIKRKQGS